MMKFIASVKIATHQLFDAALNKHPSELVWSIKIDLLF